MRYLPLTFIVVAGLASAQAPPTAPREPAGGAIVVSPATVTPLVATPPTVSNPAAQIAVEPATKTMGASDKSAALRPEDSAIRAVAVSERPEFFHGGP
jgi:hypothetical protein